MAFIDITDRLEILQRATLGHRIELLALDVLGLSETSDVLFLLLKESLAVLT